MNLVNLALSDDRTTFTGYYEKKGLYYKFTVTEGGMSFTQMSQKFKDYNHFLGVLSKFNPYVFFLSNPIKIKNLEWETLIKVLPEVS